MRRRLIVDVETNGLLPELTAIHSLVLRDRDDPSWVLSCSGAQDAEAHYLGISQGLLEMSHAEVLYAHNGLTFDFPAIQKVTGWTPSPATKLIDTLVAARLVYSDQKEHDFALFKRGKLPGNLIGRHSLEAWGERLGVKKIEWTEGWEKWTPAMQTYCEQDTLTTHALILHLAKRGVPMQALTAEQALQLYLWHQEEKGWPFDEAGAQALQAELSSRREELRTFLVAHFGSWMVPTGPVKVAKVNFAKRGIPKGSEYQNFKSVEFNPGSRAHIAKRLQVQFGWVPEKFTETNQVAVDETVLEGLLHIPGIPELKEFLLVEKRLGQIAEGKQAWLKQVKGGRIHGRVNSLGAITHRATHSNPNLSQVPAVTAPYGERCRALFMPPVGYQQMGADASGLELRCLAHYMAKYDNGVYGRVLLEEDIHTANQKAIREFVGDGKEGRSIAKTFI
jgi:DNA polymerase-1